MGKTQSSSSSERDGMSQKRPKPAAILPVSVHTDMGVAYTVPSASYCQ